MGTISRETRIRLVPGSGEGQSCGKRRACERVFGGREREANPWQGLPGRATKTVNPDYPAAARERWLNADVHLKILVDSRGLVAKADVLDRAPLFEANAIKAVKKWRFKPAKRNGIPVPIVRVVTTTFRVTKQP
jgi:TonB family protein